MGPSKPWFIILDVLALSSILDTGPKGVLCNADFYGARIGDFPTYAHAIAGSVYAVDEDTLFVKEFSYDGNAPDAYFWVGTGSQPSPRGRVVPYPEIYSGRDPPKLKPAQNEDVILNLPSGMKIRDIDYISVWCRRFTVNYAHVMIPKSLRIPKQVELAQFSRLGHGVSSGNVTILDERTFYIPYLNFDGLARDTYFLVGRGFPPSMDDQSSFLYVPDEQGKTSPLRAYIGEDIEIQLPEGHKIQDFEWLSVFCKSCNQNFGHVKIPRSLFVPPALGQTKITPYWWYKQTTPPPMTKGRYPNCIEPLPGRLQVRWALDNQDLLIQMSGKLQDDQYMAFGISPAKGRSQMIGGDATVTFYDRREDTFRVQDYFIKDKKECDGNSGTCPDVRFGGTNDVTFIDGEMTEGITIVTFRRPLMTRDFLNDVPIRLNESVNIIASIGLLNDRREVKYHHNSKTTATSDTRAVRFSSVGRNTCGGPLGSSSSSTSSHSNSKSHHRHRHNKASSFYFIPWEKNELAGVTDFQAQIGPTGGARGFDAMTGKQGLSIAWWINGLLVPELYLERGKTYNFTIEGGNDPMNPSKYHPFYITDSPSGGFQQKQKWERAKERVFAGVRFDAEGNPTPTARGRLCEWTHISSTPVDDYETFDDFKHNLRLECDDRQGEPGELIWTVPHDAPNELYYQCYSHRNLGWKIHVRQPGFRLQQGEEENSGSSVTSWRTAHQGDLLAIIKTNFLLLAQATLVLAVRWRSCSWCL